MIIGATVGKLFSTKAGIVIMILLTLFLAVFFSKADNRKEFCNGWKEHPEIQVMALLIG